MSGPAEGSADGSARDRPREPGCGPSCRVGSNLGDRRHFLRQAVDSLPDVVAVSSVYETDPMGGPEQGLYLNLMVEMRTAMGPRQLLSLCHRIEAMANRTRGERWGPRTLDMDIVWMDGVTMDEEHLTIPHPRWKERRFVLAPLHELAPDLIDERDIQLSEGTVRSVGEL